MSQRELLRILGYIWAAFGVYWIAVGSRVKVSQTHESPLYRVTRLAVLAITFALLFSESLSVGFLGLRFVPRLPAIPYFGFAFAIAGLALAMWARVHLGQYWSDKVVLKAGHQLIRSGPYARMRHPIYSGVLLGIAGTALLVGEWRGALAFALLLTNYTIKAKKEEAILSDHFGDEFQIHRSRAGFLLPRFIRRS